MALAGIEGPEHHLISMDELEGLRSGSEFVLQALCEVFPELMQDDTVLDLAGTGNRNYIGTDTVLTIRRLRNEKE